MADTISMCFPADTEYISAIRLAVSGIAGTREYHLDEIEDLKSCVAEACLLLLGGQKSGRLNIKLDVDDSVIYVNVSGTDVKADEGGDFVDFNDEISRILIDALSENAVFEEHNGLLESISFTKRHAG